MIKVAKCLSNQVPLQQIISKCVKIVCTQIFHDDLRCMGKIGESVNNVHTVCTPATVLFLLTRTYSRKQI